MPVDAEGRWRPGTSPKQDLLRARCRDPKRPRIFMLANGTRLSTKTIGALHCIAEHAWNRRMANAILITISQTVGLDSGIWRDLTNVILADWISGGFGMLWVKKPFIQGVSKKPSCELINKHAYEEDGTPLFETNKDGVAIDNPTLRAAGGVSTIQLESLQNEDEVEDRFKPRRYTAIFCPELSTFHKRKTFTTWTECLRSVTAREDDTFLFLADTNPADEGPDSWIYEVWFDLLGCADDACDPNELPLKRNLDRIDFEIDDNIFDPPERLEELKSKYFYDKDLYDRYILGIWRKSSEDSIFTKSFDRNSTALDLSQPRWNPILS